MLYLSLHQRQDGADRLPALLWHIVRLAYLNICGHLSNTVAAVCTWRSTLSYFVDTPRPPGGALHCDSEDEKQQ